MALAGRGLDWVGFATAATDRLQRAVGFQRSCWHLVDPGTVLFTGSLNREVPCSGSWLAEHEYILDDVNQWWFLARSGRVAGATSLATHGDLTRCLRYHSHEAIGIGDELWGALVADGAYWGAVGFLRDASEPWFTEDDVRLLTQLSAPIAEGLRRGLLQTSVAAARPGYGPGVVVFDENGEAESISPAAEQWIERMVELPPPSVPVEVPVESKIVRALAAQARRLRPGNDPLGLGARSRVRTADGSWLLRYATPLSGGQAGRIAVIIQPATPNEVAPLVALAYGLSERECQVTRLCMVGQSTKEIVATLHLSPYTVQDHLKSIFDVPRWEQLSGAPAGWTWQAASE